jgi:sialic acid synthase SpsE
LRTIPDMIQRFGLDTGFSDHTLYNTTAITSVALAAPIIEKHFTLDCDGGGPDGSFFPGSEDLASVVRRTCRLEHIGSGRLRPQVQ